ncbi:MAG: hypothetical protein Q9201_004763 [Fulgogasparrea decipioides]
MSHPIPPQPIYSAPPPRSTTAPTSSSTSTTSKQASQLHHHHHIHRSSHRPHHSRDHRVPQSAVLPTSSSNPFKDSGYPIARDLFSPLAKVGRGLEGRGHEVRGHDAGEAIRNPLEEHEVPRQTPQEKQEQERRIWADVEARRRGRESGINLTTLSTTQTRRLDYAYYALLSHLSSLVSTLSSLQSISSSTVSLLETFETSTTALTRETSGTISQFSDFTLQAQTERSQRLDIRVKRAREKVGTLEHRLLQVRESIEKEEAREKEVSRTRRFRWKCLGFLILSVCGLMIFGGLVRRWPGPVPEGTGSRGLEDRLRWEDTRGQSQEMEDTNVMSMMNGERDENTTKPQVRTNDGWEPRLRMLEEL